LREAAVLFGQAWWRYCNAIGFLIERDAEDELRSDEGIDATDIAVAVKDGVVTLTGSSAAAAPAAQSRQDVKKVTDIVGLANDLEPCLSVTHCRPDPSAKCRSQIGDNYTQSTLGLRICDLVGDRRARAWDQSIKTQQASREYRSRSSLPLSHSSLIMHGHRAREGLL
jgi:hypothetical protein